MLDEETRVRLSKKIAGLLRHFGPKYGLRIDDEGWADIDDLVRVIKSFPGYEWVSREDILEVVARDDKGRYQISGNRIRAIYGHSLKNVRIRYEECSSPPRILYHGTPARNIRSIMNNGLVPGKRNWVHLAVDESVAYDTGRRYGRPVVIFGISTRCLQARGISIYKANDYVYLVKRVPKECLRVLDIKE